MNNQEGVDALFQYATEGILVVNDRGIIVRVNPSAEKLFGYLNQELIDKPIETLIPKRFSEKHISHRDGFNKNPNARHMGAGLQLFGLKKDGLEFPVEISLSPYTMDGKKYVIAFIVDITDRRQAEEKLKNYSEELEKQVKNRTLILEEAINELEKTKNDLHNSLIKEKELNELKSRFVSMVSHEFRTPLTTMMSSLSLVTKYGDQNDKENQQKHVNKIKSAINNLIDVLNDLLSISKLEEGKVEYLPEQIDANNFFNETLSDLKSLFKPEHELVYIHKGKELIYADKKILKNIIFNLVSNAIKFSEKGKIEIFSEVTNSKLNIKVKDNGIGISMEDQKSMFERFFRGRNATHIQGTGLGLNIVLKYLEIMNGKIAFESKENIGTTFIITIPQ